MKKTQKVKIKGSKSLPGGIEGFFARPLLPLIILLLLPATVYFRTLFLDYTRLDDSIFIVENARYNADPQNLIVSFQRGLFNPTKDAYYRPVFLVDFIIESRLFGTSPAGYHFTNLLFHLISVALLFHFLKKTGIAPPDAFLITALFSVHPVLTQAVAWIPGRNDMLLMIFFFSGFILLLDHLEKPNTLKLLMQAFFFLVALFTKETAVIIPFLISGFVLFSRKTNVKKLIWPALTWIVAFGIYYFVRSQATLAGNWIKPGEMISAGIGRLGVVIQYLGKIFIPVNLTVFPEYEDITMVWGIVATVLFAGLIFYSKSYRKPLTYLGLFWFLAFLLPVLMVPKSLNDQVFEHRLYLPVIGILLVLSQGFPFAGMLEERKKLFGIGAVVVLFSSMSIYRSGYFKDPVTFWTAAVEGSPHSAYAHTLLGTKVQDTARMEQLFRCAYSLNPDLKNLNYYIGKLLMDQKKPDSAELFLRREVVKNEIPDAWFLLAQVMFERSQFDSAAIYLEKVIALDPLHPQANHNLVLLYYHHDRKEKARELVQQMQAKGMDVGLDMINLVKE